MAELYDITLPVLLRYLDNLDGLLGKVGMHLRDSGVDEAALLDRTLQEGMFPLKWQLKIAIGFALRTVNPLLPVPLAEPDGPINTIEDMRALAREARSALSAIPREALVVPEDMRVSEKAGQAAFERPALEFVTCYALPNFFFHLTTAYAILRRAGCPIGKGDFDGFHHYQAGVDLVRAVKTGAGTTQ